MRALSGRLEPKNRAYAVQDFRHAVQSGSEAVSDYIRRIERTFHLAYGRDDMLKETREIILYSQLQECLLYCLMKSPAVSGAQTYSELCLAAKNEEKRQAELEKRRQYYDTKSRAQKPERTMGHQPPLRQNIDQRQCYL